jgi:hypothetical protein
MAPPRPPTTGAARTPCTGDLVVAYSRSSGFARVRSGAAYRTAARQIARRSPTKPFSSRPRSVSPCRSGVLILTATIRTGEHRFHEPLPVASRPGNLCQMWRAVLGPSCSRTIVEGLFSEDCSGATSPLALPSCPRRRLLLICDDRRMAIDTKAARVPWYFRPSLKSHTMCI